ncbi:MAG TPA: ATP phosphoribosyltransferase regulatory subunit [Candidatus Saccharimonadales bacterium]|nr:ATP phosphoribosyltransferase regulatory subunit [Candidatus Saccharimonadales bacterium]
MQKAPPTPKGFRDILPEVAKKRRETIRKIEDVLLEFDFVPLETPTLEFAETLTGKYGEEEKLIYKFKDRGDRDLALRYDLTVPLARFIANNQTLLKPTFSRYQIGQVFRGENPQHGRWREFTQFDFDTVGFGKGTGDQAAKEDAKIIATAIKAARAAGLDNAVMTINHRASFSDIPIEATRVFDKWHKIGSEGVKKELSDLGLSDKFEEFKTKLELGKKNSALANIIGALRDLEMTEDKDFSFDWTLARGLDYYTGVIFELKPDNNLESLSIGAGGRYDNLIGMFAGKQIPAVGFSFGIDRIVDILQ